MSKPVIRRRPIKVSKRPAPTPPPAAPEPEAMSASQRQMQSAVQYIMTHPQYVNILASIRMGTTNGDIADHFIERGDFQINRKTVLLYLAAFRRARPDLCKPKDVEQGDNVHNLKDYDHIFDGNVIRLTEEIELQKLIQLQKSRLAIDFDAERRIGKLFNTTEKEVNRLGELIEKLAKIRGTIKPASHVHFANVSEEDVRDGLAAIRQDEANRSVLREAVGQVVNSVMKQRIT